MQLIRLVMYTVVMGSMLNVMAMERETIEQKRVAAVKRYRYIKGPKFNKAFLINMPGGTDSYTSGWLEKSFLESIDESCIQGLSLIEESDSQEEKNKALHRLVRMYNRRSLRKSFHRYEKILMKAIKTVVEKGADPNLENDTKCAGDPLYIALKRLEKKKNDDLLQFLFTYGARTDLPKAAVWVREVFEEYNKNQEKLKK